MTPGGKRVVLIAAVAANGVIGADGDIPWRLPEDFAHFKATTMGHTLVMGRATYDSIGRPLPGRTTIVLTRDPAWSVEGPLVADSLEKAFAMADDLAGDVYVAGGASVYAAALPHADEQILTEVHQSPEGDTYYPSYDPAEWVETSREAHEGFDVVRWAGLRQADPMELRVFTEPQQGATYDDLLRVARLTEELGFGAFFRSDHYLAIGGDGLPGPSDAWVTLAGLARETSTIRLGTLMTSATFRLPGPLAISVANVDQMSGGRVELGLGAGWYGAEHSAYGIPFPDTHERFDRLAEQLAVITGLWGSDGTFTHDGVHYWVEDSPGLPKPAQAKVPLIIGGSGKRRTPALAAQYADEFNLPFVPFEDGLPQNDRVRQACEAIDRDPATMIFSSALVLCVGADDAEVRRRADAIGQDAGHLRATQLGGTVEEVVDKIGRYAESGQSRLYLQTLDLDDLDHLRLVAQEVMPRVAGR